MSGCGGAQITPIQQTPGQSKVDGASGGGAAPPTESKESTEQKDDKSAVGGGHGAAEQAAAGVDQLGTVLTKLIDLLTQLIASLKESVGQVGQTPVQKDDERASNMSSGAMAPAAGGKKDDGGCSTQGMIRK
jgi:hypothetical protein